MKENSLEKVMCIRNAILFEDGRWNGLKTDGADMYMDLITTKSEFKPRLDLEENDEYRQVIAQIVLKYQDKYFLYKQVDESVGRLNSLCSVLLGGHIVDSSIDVAFNNELKREVDMDAEILEKRFKGILNLEDEKIRSSKHLGLIYEMEIDSNNIMMKDKGYESIGFVSMDYLKTNPEKLSYWSKFIIYHL